jgi:hypothetical protein
MSFFKQNITQEGKTSPVWGWYHWEGECYKEKMKVGKEYDVFMYLNEKCGGGECN